MLLPDVNVWLALAFDFDEHHVRANAWFENSSETCAFCRLTPQGFLRLATNPSALKDEAVSLREAWRMYDAILSDPSVTFAPEPTELEKQWRAYTQRRTFSPKVWSDAYLAAFAQVGGYELVTFDKAFGQYRIDRCTILS